MPSSDVKPHERPKAIDLYDDRVRTFLASWKAELRAQHARRQTEFDRWLREQRDRPPVKE
jgi:hypothetical protein